MSERVYAEPEAPTPVLIVDDRIENRMALRAVLESPDYEIVEASSGEEALRRLLAGPFAVLLVDVLMPGMSGFELAAIVRQRDRKSPLPILFLTAQASDPSFIRQAYGIGAADYLVKPFIPAMVRAKVAVFAELYRQRQRVEYQAKLLLEAARKETELKLLELRLSAERRFRYLADAIPHIIWTARADGTVDYFNRRWFEYTGQSVPEPGESWHAAVHPEDLVRCAKEWRAAAAAGEPRVIECRLRRAIDGSYRWHLLRVLPQRGPRGKIEGWIGTFTDVEEQTRERAVLAELKGTLDAVQDAVIIFNAESWCILYSSQGASKILGYSADELMHMSPGDLMPEFDEQRLQNLLGPAGALESARAAVETHYRCKDGSVIPVEVSLQHIRIDGGRIVSIGRDITDRKRSEAEREELYRKAIAAVQVRDEFLTIASHELKTPLTSLTLSIDSLVHLIRQQGDVQATADRRDEKLRMATRQVQRLTHIIDTLLDFSRMNGERLKIEPADVDLVALVRDVTDRLRDDLERAGCSVTLAGETALPGRWDPVRMQQVVSQLLSNAAKFGAGKPIEVTVEASPDNAYLLVRDYGIGIPAEDQERIFERFGRAVNAGYGGLGLGLFLVKQIVAAHGGEVRVTSEPGSGTTFTIELPRETAAG